MTATDDNRKVRDLFVYLITLVYMFAFGSWVPQLPGLYGNKGIIPIQNKVFYNQSEYFIKQFTAQPTLLYLFMRYGYSAIVSLQIVSVLGVFISFICLIFAKLRTSVPIFCLWFLYFSLVRAGETFAHFQWDILLLEVGFLTIFVARLPCGISEQTSKVWNRLSFWLVKWCLFRLMLASGVVKLTSNCPTWWKLTALNYHFETQCIPTPAAWWAHQLPFWFLKLSVMGTYLIEIGLPFLFFMPSRRLRLFGAYAQIFLMFVISVTGSYNYFNILTAVMCLSCMDDKHLKFFTGSKNTKKNQSIISRYCYLIFDTMVLSYILFQTITWFSIKFNHQGDFIHSKITFSYQEFQWWVNGAVMYSMWMAGISFIWNFTKIFLGAIKEGRTKQNKCTNCLKTTVAGMFCTMLFVISMVPFNYISTERNLWPITHKWHNSVGQFQLVNSYGLFRQMTGVEGRPEVILEGKMQNEENWKEYHFLYKPGNVTHMPPWLVPHQPRLDWQMWFAALGSYQHNPWLINLAYQILSGSNDVISLLDKSNLPFNGKPPHVIRAKLYHYHMTSRLKDGSLPKASWRRKLQGEYFPELTKDNKHLIEFLEFSKLIVHKIPTVENDFLITTLNNLQDILTTISIPIALWALWFTALILSWSKNYIFSQFVHEGKTKS